MRITKRPKEVNLFFNSLEDIKSLNVWNINKELSNCDKIRTTAWRKKIIIERKVLFHNLNGGQLHSNAQSTNKKGKVEKVLQFSTTEVNYIIARLNETNNSWEYRVTYFTQIVKKVVVNACIVHWSGHRMQFCANE